MNWHSKYKDAAAEVVHLTRVRDTALQARRDAERERDAATARAEELERERDDLLARLNEVVHQHLDTMVERDEAKADRDRLADENEHLRNSLDYHKGARSEAAYAREIDRLVAEVERAKVLLGRVELRDGQKMAGVREDIDAWFTQRQEGNAGAEDDKIEDSSPGGEREAADAADAYMGEHWSMLLDLSARVPNVRGEESRLTVRNLVRDCVAGVAEAWQARSRAAPAGASEVRRLLDLFRDIVDGSEGVAGWHRNGDVAGWDEIECDLVDKLGEVLALLGKE